MRSLAKIGKQYLLEILSSSGSLLEAESEDMRADTRFPGNRDKSHSNDP